MAKKKENIFRKPNPTQSGTIKVFERSICQARLKDVKNEYIFFLQLKAIAGQTGGLYNYYNILLAEYGKKSPEDKEGYCKSTIYANVRKLKERGWIRTDNSKKTGAKYLVLMNYNQVWQSLGCQVDDDYYPEKQSHVPVYKLEKLKTKTEIELGIWKKEIERLQEKQIRAIAEKDTKKKNTETDKSGLNNDVVRGKQRFVNSEASFSLEYLANYFGYKSHVTAGKRMDKLEKLGLVQIERDRKEIVRKCTYEEHRDELGKPRNYFHQNGFQYRSLPNLYTFRKEAKKQNKIKKPAKKQVASKLESPIVKSSDTHIIRLEQDSKLFTIDYEDAINFCIGPEQVSEHYGIRVVERVTTADDAALLVKEAIINNAKYLKEEASTRERKRINDWARKKNLKFQLKKKKEGFDFEVFNAYLDSIERIDNKVFSWEICKAGRVHTNFTNLAKDLRPFVKLNGQTLHYADIRNCQPLLFALVLIDHYKAQGKDAYEVADVKEYIELCLAGKFYDTLMEREGIICEDEKEQKAIRDDFKVKFFAKVFFSKTSTKRIPKEVKAFNKQFPTVYAHAVEMKAKNHADLSMLLQKKESDIIINKTVKNIYKTNSDINLITCHDAIYATADNIQLVIDALYNAFEKEYGVRPTIEVGKCEKKSKREEEIEEYLMAA